MLVCTSIFIIKKKTEKYAVHSSEYFLSTFFKCLLYDLNTNLMYVSTNILALYCVLSGINLDSCLFSICDKCIF